MTLMDDRLDEFDVDLELDDLIELPEVVATAKDRALVAAAELHPTQGQFYEHLAQAAQEDPIFHRELVLTTLRPPEFDKQMMAAIEEDIAVLALYGSTTHVVDADTGTAHRVEGRRAGKSPVGGDIIAEIIAKQGEYVVDLDPTPEPTMSLKEMLAYANEVRERDRTWRREWINQWAESHPYPRFNDRPFARMDLPPVQPLDVGQLIPIVAEDTRRGWLEYLCMCTPGRGDFFGRYQEGVRASRGMDATHVAFDEAKALDTVWSDSDAT